MAKYILSDIFQGDFPVTQPYGANPDYYKQFNLAGHEGVDFGTPNGTPILAPFDGEILRDTFNDKDYGNFTVVWDPKQLCAVWFCHLLYMTTKVGDQVKKGQLLGYTNNTGNTTGPHLHFNFVETDAQGNRLNLNNEYQGFLNALDPNLVEWQLTTSQIQGGGSMANMYGSPNQYDLNNPDSMKVAVDILNKVQTGFYVEKTKYDADIAAAKSANTGNQDIVNKFNQFKEALKPFLS